MNAEVLRAANSELKSKFPSVEVLALQLDVRKTSEVRDGIAETMKKFGRLDVAVNNAGIGGSGRKTHELDEEEFARVADVNLSGVWRCQREELKVMVEQEYVCPMPMLLDIRGLEGVSRSLEVSSARLSFMLMILVYLEASARERAVAKLSMCRLCLAS